MIPHPTTVLALLVAYAALPTAVASQTVAIPDVTIVDVREGVARPGMTIVVSGDRIAAVGPSGSVEVPGDARMVDGTGRFLIPGLWDMHVHTGNDRNAREVVYPLYVAHGVTGIRNMSGDCLECPMASIEQVHARRRAVAAGELIGPRVVASSDYAGSHEQAARRSTDGSSPEAPATNADARAFVRLAKERGVDFIKIYDMLPRRAYFALAEEANRLGLPFAGETPVAVRASEASDTGQASTEHLGFGNILEECSSKENELRARLIAASRSEQSRHPVRDARDARHQ
jgi:imidazolonepropionase-like amidohydrolase